MSSLPVGLCELLRSFHFQSLKNDEVLLLRDSRRLADYKDVGAQVETRNLYNKYLNVFSTFSEILAEMIKYLVGDS